MKAQRPEPKNSIGFVGLGDMGGPIAHRIAVAGFPLAVWSRGVHSLKELGAQPFVAVPSLQELGNRCGVVAVCVFSDADVRDVVLGADGLLGLVFAFLLFASAENQWAILLAHFRIPYLHMREFAHHLPPFDHLTGDERENVLHSLIQTIKRCNLAGFGAVVRLPDLQRFNRERSRQLEAQGAEIVLNPVVSAYRKFDTVKSATVTPLPP